MKNKFILLILLFITQNSYAFKEIIYGQSKIIITDSRIEINSENGNKVVFASENPNYLSYSVAQYWFDRNQIVIRELYYSGEQEYSRIVNLKNGNTDIHMDGKPVMSPYGNAFINQVCSVVQDKKFNLYVWDKKINNWKLELALGKQMKDGNWCVSHGEWLGVDRYRFIKEFLKGVDYDLIECLKKESYDLILNKYTKHWQIKDSL